MNVRIESAEAQALAWSCYDGVKSPRFCQGFFGAGLILRGHFFRKPQKLAQNGYQISHFGLLTICFSSSEIGGKHFACG
jgi:hypothetical protein